jgi:hypothetical protein
MQIQSVLTNREKIKALKQEPASVLFLYYGHVYACYLVSTRGFPAFELSERGRPRCSAYFTAFMFDLEMNVPTWVCC